MRRFRFPSSRLAGCDAGVNTGSPDTDGDAEEGADPASDTAEMDVADDTTALPSRLRFRFRFCADAEEGTDPASDTAEMDVTDDTVSEGG